MIPAVLIDLPTVATSAITALASSALALFAAKRLVSGLIDSRIRRADELHAADVREMFRRRGELFDQQIQALDEFMDLIYRMRNSSRALAREEQAHEYLKKAIRTLRALVDSYREDMFKRRAILPSPIFALIHELTEPVSELLVLTEKLQRADETSKPKVRVELENCFMRIDAGYAAFVELVHDYRGVAIHPVRDAD